MFHVICINMDKQNFEIICNRSYDILLFKTDLQFSKMYSFFKSAYYEQCNQSL